jgi:tetratricopeptide (TPR) repeat protein
MGHFQRLIVLAVLFGLSSATLWGQGELDRALLLGSQGQWNEARDVLLVALDDEHRTDAHAWYLYGFVEKERYALNGGANPADPAREAAVQALQRARSLGPTEEDAESSAGILTFLAGTYFRDAVFRVQGFTVGSDEAVLALYSRYAAITLSVDPRADLTDQKVDILAHLAEANVRLIQSNLRPEEGDLFDRAVAHYEQALDMKPGHYTLQYNQAITLYNHGVRQLKRIDHETSMFALMDIQDACVGLFEQALPFMQSAHQARPDRLETLKGLMAIRRALSQPEKSDQYEREIERVLGRR